MEEKVNEEKNTKLGKIAGAAGGRGASAKR